MSGSVLITGANGRIGSLLMEGLAKAGWSVRGCDVADGPDGVAQGDICDLETMQGLMKGCRSVIHLAGTPNAKPGWEAVNRLNIDGTRTILEAARREGVSQIIYASSIHTIGGLPARTPFVPDLPDRPSGSYGVSKLASEGLLRVYSQKADIRAISVRICSFRPAPVDARELRTWIGYDDTVHLFDRCLCDETQGYQMIWGLSGNTRVEVDDPTARRIEYHPQQNAESHIANITGDPDVEPWPLMGGPVAADAETDFLD
ncbi:NAD(P)-dependent oxidoreductase [Nereida sp. MMG025]|uniref:NAD-dependent epimerase/dehydratase family protein n=1 Tax=Nereida sp. MMG025 TaxID=2909981 RepID=UPI001F2A6653|nr:NAD(P)-dependent oxidoreductase [Nereida sp. MMG025]MCF6443546.1 NAD(P)-dependent oxidoreductase [Nereida sp. MMG025]